MSLLQVLKFHGKMGDTMADKNYLHTAYANSADGTDGFATVYPNLNLEQHTAQLIGTDNKLIWGLTGNRTETTTYESVSISDDSRIKTGIHFTQITTGQSGWRGPSGSNGGSIPVVSGEKYTISVYLKNNSSNDVVIDLQLGTCNNPNDQTSNVKYVLAHITVPANSDYKKYSATVTIPSGNSYAWCYAYTANNTTSADWSMAGYKLEQGSTATPWMPSASEATTADWPKYVGTYVDTNPVSSTDPSKYGWDEMKYRVYLDGVAVGGSKLLSFDLENLKAGTSYNVQVNQINGNDESDKSESVAFKTTLTK